MLKSPIWQAIGVIVGIVAIFVSVTLYNQQKIVKRLQVEVLSNNPLVSVSSEVTSDIQVLYKDQAVKSLSVILLKFSNIGNAPITESDYSEPITVSIAPSAQVGEVKIQERSPADIQLTAMITASNEITLSKALLNPGDQVVVRILAIDNDGTLRITGRIAGIQQIEVKSVVGAQGTNSDTSGFWVLGCMGSLVLLSVGSGIWNSRKVKLWRRDKLGYEYDPAADYYWGAYWRAFRRKRDLGEMQLVVSDLDHAISLDASYLAKAQEEDVFAEVRKYGPSYKEMIKKHTEAGSGSAEGSKSN